jgi:DNA end-binding protein Ku
MSARCQLARNKSREFRSIRQMASTVWKGFLSFGLVSFPVRLFAAARSETVHFHLLHRKDLSRVKEVWYCAKEEKRIERSEMVKGYELSKGKYVAVEEAELKKIEPPTASTMEIVQFVRSDEIDPIYFERSYYVAPGGNIAKPYSLFTHALEESKYYAIANLSLHGREHVVLIRPAEDALVLHTLFYARELRKENRHRESMKVDRKELDLAKSLIKQLAAPFKPAEFHDSYRQNVETLIQQKQKGEPISVVERPQRAQVIDLMDALKRSLKASGNGLNAAKSSARRKAEPIRRGKVAWGIQSVRGSYVSINPNYAQTRRVWDLLVFVVWML